jgi:uncharacterized membrane protein
VTNEPLAILVQLAAGLALAACCGLRAFLPPLLLGLAGRFGVSEILLGRPILSPTFEWLSSTPALVIFGVAVVFEVLADKVPALDHLLDMVQTAVRPLAGALVVAASFSPLGPLPAGVFGLVAGTPVAGVVHLGKAKIRALSTLGTGGLGSPVLSVIEDAATLIGSTLALVTAIVALVLIGIGAFITFRIVRSFLRRVGRLRQDLTRP